jgi:hypothetical protein
LDARTIVIRILKIGTTAVPTRREKKRKKKKKRWKTGARRREVSIVGTVLSTVGAKTSKEQIPDLRIDNSVAGLVSKTANSINRSQRTLHRGLNSLVRGCGTKC